MVPWKKLNPGLKKGGWVRGGCEGTKVGPWDWDESRRVLVKGVGVEKRRERFCFFGCDSIGGCKKNSVGSGEGGGFGGPACCRGPRKPAIWLLTAPLTLSF